MNGTNSRTIPLSILIIDDELNIRKTLTVCLETEGHHYCGATNGT